MLLWVQPWARSSCILAILASVIFVLPVTWAAQKDEPVSLA
jgi:hypothetical protein